MSGYSLSISNSYYIFFPTRSLDLDSSDTAETESIASDSTAIESEATPTFSIRDRFNTVQEEIKEKLAVVNAALAGNGKTELDIDGCTLVKPMLKQLSEDIKNQKLSDDSRVLNFFYKESIDTYSTEWIEYLEKIVLPDGLIDSALINTDKMDPIEHLEKLNKIFEHISKEKEKLTIENLKRKADNPSLWKTEDIKSIGNSIAIIGALIIKIIFKILGAINSAFNFLWSSVLLFRNHYKAVLTRYQTLLNNIKTQAEDIRNTIRDMRATLIERTNKILKASNKSLEASLLRLEQKQANAEIAHAREIKVVHDKFNSLEQNYSLAQAFMAKEIAQIQASLGGVLNTPIQNSPQPAEKYTENLNSGFRGNRPDVLRSFSRNNIPSLSIPNLMIAIS